MLFLHNLSKFRFDGQVLLRGLGSQGKSFHEHTYACAVHLHGSHNNDGSTLEMHHSMQPGAVKLII